MIEIIYGAVIAMIGLGLGRLLLRRAGLVLDSLAEELSFSLGLGLGCVALGVMILGFSHLLYAPLLYALLALGGVAGCRDLIGLVGRVQGRMRGVRLSWRSFYFWLGLLVVAGVLLNLLRALTPAHGAVDPLAYHLALPKIYLQKHALSFEPTINGALYPANVGMLYTLGIGLHGAELAQLLHWGMGLCCLIFVGVFCRRYFDLRTGVWAAAIFSVSPVVFYFSPLGYIDVGVCFFQLLAAWALCNWCDRPGDKMLGLAAVLTGLALGAKHSALPMWAVGAAVVLGVGFLRGQGWRRSMMQTAIFAGAALALAGPWYGRSFLESGNPVWPIVNHIFDGFPYYSVYGGGAGEANPPSTATVGWFPSGERIAELSYWVAVSLWKWSFEPADLQRAVGPYIVVLLPGLLLYARTRRPLFLFGFCLINYALLVVVVGGVPRYTLFLFALLSALTGYVAESFLTRRRPVGLPEIGGWRYLAMPFALIWGYGLQGVVLATMGFNLVWGYGLAEASIDYFKQGKTQSHFLAEREGNYRVFQAVNKQLPAGSKVLLQGIVKGYYCDKPYLWDHPYQRVINYTDYENPDALVARMGELDISHVVRMITVPPGRVQLGYPQYFADEFHEAFRKKYLQLLYRDESYVLFAVKYR